MVKINIDKELEQELKGAEEIEQQIHQLDDQKMELVRQLFRKQGIILFLQAKKGG